MDISGTAVAILCMPCRRIGGHFQPTNDLVLADLSGREDRHPIHALATRCHEPQLLNELHQRRTRNVLLLFDDLAVTRSWMLPANPPSLDELWPQIQQATKRLTAPARLPVEILRFSEFLERHNVRRRFDLLIARYAERFAAPSAGTDRAEKAAMEHELARRHRYAREAGTRAAVNGLRYRAAAQLANYAAQGALMHHTRVGAYIPWTTEEIDLMAIKEPTFRTNVIAAYYGHGPRNSRQAGSAAQLDRIPLQFGDLRSELALYLRDLPTTPGAVVSGLVDDITEALVKFLTPGLEASARREIVALNHVLPGGTINRLRVEALLGEVSQPGISLRTREVTIKKLLCHLASRYENDQVRSEYRRHRTALDSLIARIPAGAGIALGLTGSLTDAPVGMWHPYLSDVDAMPLCRAAPPPSLVDQIRHAYTSTPRPPWLYLNTGAQAGIGGLTRDPHTSLFTADQITSLSAREFAYLDGCTRRLRFIAGDRDAYRVYVRALSAERNRRLHESPHAEARWTP